LRAVLLISFLSVATLGLSAQQAPAPPAGAQAPPPANPIPTITTTLRQVVLDVVVTDKEGRPVKGLKPSDFALTEDGAPQTLAAFTEQVASTSTPPPAPEPKLPPNTFVNHAPLTGNGAITVILFDELSFVDTAYARDQVSSFIKTLTPGMPICIFKLDWQGLHLIQDFTTDPLTLRQAINSKRNNAPMPRPLGYWQPSLIGDAMNELARYLSGFSGRKNLIWFTDGQPPELSNRLFPDITSLFDDRTGTIDVLTLSRVALYPIDARGLVVNARRGFDILVEDGELAQVAEATGGRAFYSTNGFKEAVAEVVANGSNYYTLAYNPTNTNWNGAFRKIKLQLVNTAYSDAASQSAPAQPAWPFRLEYRQGYYATQFTPHGPFSAAGTRRMISYSPKGDPADPSQSPPLRLAMAFGAVAPFQILFQAHVAPDPAINKLKRHEQPPKNNYLDAKWLHSAYRNYEIHYSVDAHDIQFKQGSMSAYNANLQFIAVLYNDDGVMVNSLITTVPIELDLNQYLQVINGGIGLTQTIAVPTHGDFFLRLGVHDLNSGRVGALEIPAESIQLTPAAAPSAKSN
jgi:VWFA-related protein